jgi:hypothetical protein
MVNSSTLCVLGVGPVGRGFVGRRGRTKSEGRAKRVPSRGAEPGGETVAKRAFTHEAKPGGETVTKRAFTREAKGEGSRSKVKGQRSRVKGQTFFDNSYPLGPSFKECEKKIRKVFEVKFFFLQNLRGRTSETGGLGPFYLGPFLFSYERPFQRVIDWNNRIKTDVARGRQIWHHAEIYGPLAPKLSNILR